MARKLVSGTGKSCGAGPRVLTSFPLCPARHCLPRGPAVLGAPACSFGSGGSMLAGAGKRRFVVGSRLLCSRPASVPYSVIPRGPAVGDRPRTRGRFRALAGAPRRRSLPASLVALSRSSSRDWGRRRRRLRASAAGARLGRNALRSGPLVFGVAFPRVTACANPGAQGVTASANSSQGHC